MENQPSFEYTYSARQRQEIESIRQKYLPKEEDKMEQLRRLHHSATQKAQGASISIGTVGTLLLGTGMSLCLTDIGAALGAMAMVLGCFLGLSGMVLSALAYPIYSKVLQKERARIAPEVLRLSEELLK